MFNVVSAISRGTAKGVRLKSSIRSMALAFFASMLFAPAVMAADPEPYNPDPSVHGSLTLYGWYVFPGGDITIGDKTIGIGGGDGSIFDILDGFFMANGELRYGDFGVYGDVVYAGLSDDNTNSGWELDALMVTGLLTYDIMRSSSGFVQVGVGARYWEVDTGFYIGLIERDRNPNWVDFVGGFRGQQYLSDALYIEGTALVGFGGSDFMWDVYGGLGYNFTSNFSGSVGYRGMGVNYEAGLTELDLTLHGPFAALTLRF